MAERVRTLKLGDQEFDLRFDFFLCPSHGLIVPSKFNTNWTTDEGCPVPTYKEEPCGEKLTAVFLDTTAEVPEQPEGEMHRWVLVSELDDLETEVCVQCGAQRDKNGPVAERAVITGGWPSADCDLVLPGGRSVDQILDDLRAEIDRQDRKYGPYQRQSRLGVSRLALATLEDEVAEAKDAWREERRMSDWPHTREEVLQVAAVAVRTLRDALGPQEVDGG